MIPEPSSDVVCAACTHCDCCIVYRVGVTGSDVYRMSRGLGLHPRDFTMPVQMDPAQSGPDWFFFNSEVKPFELALQKQKSRLKKGAPCVFLMKFSKKHLRCGSYEDRPLICRLYPSNTSLPGVTVSTPDICPPNAWSLERVDVPTIMLLHGLWVVERDIYRSLLKRWNEMAKTFSHGHSLTFEYFHDCLINFYGALEPALSPWYETRERLEMLVETWRKKGETDDNLFDLLGGAKAKRKKLLGVLGDHVRVVVDAVEAELERLPQLDGADVAAQAAAETEED